MPRHTSGEHEPAAHTVSLLPPKAEEESQPCGEEGQLPSSAARLGHLHTENTPKWKHQLMNVLVLPCVKLSIGIHDSGHLYPAQIFHRNTYNGKKGGLEI